MSKAKAGRRKRATRPLNKTVLLVTNGAKTEIAYLKEFKQRVKAADTRITVIFQNGDPSTVIKKLTNPHGDASSYDEVWIVVDEDGADRTDFLKKCIEKSSNRQKWVGIVSRPCFEVWLVAHYTQVRKYANQSDAQRHFYDNVPVSEKTKDLAGDFPFEDAPLAAVRCMLPNTHLGDLNELPPSPGSAMPHLVNAFYS